MDRLFSWRRFGWLAFGWAAVAVALVTGCSTADDADNRSERPWNAPKSWEGGLPAGMSEGR